ncbi:MAG: hypothetical protein ACREDS_00105 [Limisphaerales bacterium]
MKKLLRILVGVASLATVIGWTVMILGVQDWRAPMAGAGDGAGTESPSDGEQFFNSLLIGAIWLLPISPYLCMAAGAFNLIGGKSLRVAYVYALVVLALMTLIMAVTFMRRLELIALANVVIGALWAYSFKPQSGSQNPN